MRRRCVLWLHYPEHPVSGFLIYAMATTSLSDLMKERPENRAEARQDLQFLNAQKLSDHEAKTYHDGKWVMFEPTNTAEFDDYFKLLAIKRKPNRK